MIVYEAPNVIHSVSLFLAGGITNCPDWQAEALEMLSDIEHLEVYNPRRQNFDVNNPSASSQQILWEADALQKADMISFWFPCETLCPIALYELGAWSMTDKEIFVGCHPDYKRKFDVKFQTGLRREEVNVHTSLVDLMLEVRAAVIFK